MKTQTTKVPFGNTDNTKFARWATVIGLVMLGLITLVVVIPKLISATTVGGSVAQQKYAQVTDPYLNKGAEEIYRLLAQGGEKANMASMNPLERKMLSGVVVAIAGRGVPIEEATDASKFVEISEDGVPHILWMILYKDVNTRSLTQVIAFQIGYTLKSGVSATNTMSKPLWDYQEVIGYGIPSRLTFNDRTTK